MTAIQFIRMRSVCLSGHAARKDEKIITSPKYKAWQKEKRGNPPPTSDKSTSSGHKLRRSRGNSQTEIQSLLMSSSSQPGIGDESPSMNLAGINSSSKNNLHRLSQLKQQYFRNYGSQQLTSKQKTACTPIQESFGQLFKAKPNDKIALSGIDPDILSEFSLKVCSSEKEIDKIRHIVQALKAEQTNMPQQQLDGVKRQFGKVICSYVRFQNQLTKEQVEVNLKSSHDLCHRVEQQELVLKQIEKFSLQKDKEIFELRKELQARKQNQQKYQNEIQSCRRINFQLCKQNILLNDEICALKKQNDNLSNKLNECQINTQAVLQNLRRSNQFRTQKNYVELFGQSFENIINPEKSQLKHKDEYTNKILSESNNLLASKGKKYNSVVVKLVDENRQLKAVIEVLNTENSQLRKQVQEHEHAAKQLVIEAKILRQTIEKILKKSDAVSAVSPRINEFANTTQINHIRASLRDLASKIDTLNTKVHPQ